ncbi:reverse transcriptase [Tanacetum coccineum]|uniref:Reverse transcriptase n=1 Tax=Tanacetum coccineum TaxID=301880 RepID=A0ABQ5CYP8_9ASTR
MMRCHDGSILVAGNKCVAHATSVIEIEAYAILWAIQVALSKGFMNVILETDSRILVDAFLHNKELLHIRGLFLHIRRLCGSFTSCSWSFVRRDGNQVAHELASRALYNNVDEVYDGFVPASISSWVLNDDQTDKDTVVEDVNQNYVFDVVAECQKEMTGGKKDNGGVEGLVEISPDLELGCNDDIEESMYNKKVQFGSVNKEMIESTDGRGRVNVPNEGIGKVGNDKNTEVKVDQSLEEKTNVPAKNNTWKKSFAATITQNIVDCDRNLKVIPTMLDDNGIKVVVFDDVMVAEVNGISALASRIGKPLVMDSMTAIMCKQGIGKVRYARVLVEVNAKKELPELVEIIYKNVEWNVHCRKSVKVVYDWNPPICSECGVFGHTRNKYGKGMNTEQNKGNKTGDINKRQGSNEDFIEVNKKINGGFEEKNRRHNFKPNTQPHKFGLKVAYQAKAAIPNGKGNINVETKNQNELNSTPMKKADNVEKEKSKSEAGQSGNTKKQWLVHQEILQAMKRFANKFYVLQMYDVNDQNELEELKNMEIVDEYINKKEYPPEDVLKGEEDNVVCEDNGIGQCMEGNEISGIDEGVLED